MEPHDQKQGHSAENIHIQINRREYVTDNAIQTGRSLKELAGIPLSDALFLLKPPGEDVVFTNEAMVTVRSGEQFFSQPDATYGADLEEHTEAERHHGQQPDHCITVYVNGRAHELSSPHQSAETIKELAGVPATDRVFVGELLRTTVVDLKNGDHVFTGSPPDEDKAGTGEGGCHSDDGAKPIHIQINRKEFALASPVETGRALKELAGIPLADALFLQQPGDDAVIANDATVKLRDGDCLFSQPDATYGSGAHDVLAGLPGAQVHPQPDGWKFVIFDDFAIPEVYRPSAVRLLVKLPPTFPEAKPDMFWVQPPLILTNGALPNRATAEQILGEPWQRFSWHIKPEAWVPGVSDLRDFMRCVRGRFERKD